MRDRIISMNTRCQLLENPHYSTRNSGKEQSMCIVAVCYVLVCAHVPLQILLLSHFIYQPVDKSESPQLAYGPDSIRPALAPNEVHYLCREYKDNMKLSKDEIRRIEKDTRDQVIQALPQMFQTHFSNF